MDHTLLYLSKGYGPDSGYDHFRLDLDKPGAIATHGSDVRYCITGCA